MTAGKGIREKVTCTAICENAPNSGSSPKAVPFSAMFLRVAGCSHTSSCSFWRATSSGDSEERDPLLSQSLGLKLELVSRDWQDEEVSRTLPQIHKA